MPSPADPTITCPHCQRPIHLTQALAQPLVEARLGEERSRIAEQLKRELGGEVEQLRARYAEQSAVVESARKRELELLREKQQLDEAKANLELSNARTLAAERDKIAKAAAEAKALEMSADIQRLQQVSAEQGAKLAAAQQAELALRRDKEKLESAQREWELEKQRQIDAERVRIRDEATRELAEAQRLKDAEKDEVLAGLRRQIEDLKRKAEQGSQQTQGEALEVDLEEMLRGAFPLDTIEPVAKGVRGADCVQRVAGPTGAPIGSILWESKNTKDWSKTWLPKLRDDQREAKADVSILVSAVLPKEVARFGHVEGVWVADRASAVPLAMALRGGLVQAALARATSTGRETKMELLYQYLCGPEFRARVEGIVDAFTSMKADLDSERKSTERQWAKREKQIERVLRSTSGMYGDLQGIAGTSLPTLPSLDGPAEAPRALPDPG